MLALLALAPAAAQAESRESAQLRLAQSYAPVLFFQRQQKPCGEGEPFRPTSVDIVLGRKGVLLRDSRGAVVKRAPTAADLWGLGKGYYLDLPGNPLKPGCDYEQQFRKWNEARAPSVYAHIATDPSRPGKLAVQYWIYYTFNDFTDKHESDWEMAQVDFDAPTATAALQTGAYEVDLAQHAGGERSPWSDTKLKREGTHPVIYVATGSHASYFDNALYLGRGPREGFGCDDTRKATERAEPEIVPLPNIPASPASPYAWLAYAGHWGQQEKGTNTGPIGPGFKEQWSKPIQWSEGLRTTSVEVPGGTEFGISVGTFFCGAVTGAATGLNWALVHPPLFIALLIFVVGATLASAARTTWRPPDPRPLRMEREGGQIFGATWRIYAEHLLTFAAAGAIFVPVYVLAASIQWVLFHLTAVAPLIALDGRHGAVTALLAILVGGVGGLFASVIATGAVAVILSEIDAGRRILAGEAYRRVFKRLGPLVRGMLIEIGTVLVLTITIVGIPLAVHRFIRWSLFAQAVMLEDPSATEALAHSSELVGGQWWRTFGFTLLVDVLAVLSGPLLGVGLLLLTDHSLNFINIAASFVYCFTVPFAAIQLTLLYFDLEVRRASTSDAVMPGIARPELAEG